MRRTFRRVVGALLGAATLATPATALADGKPGQQFCPTFKQVESDATGGQYVGGILIYETMGSVTRTSDVTTTTVSTTTGTEVGVENVASAGSTTTVSVSTTEGTATTMADEPIGYYQMNDGSVYQVNCVTGQGEKVS
jgi:hypothetical protein